jgi:4-hydroxy-2-oxoglutarate aldolase
MSFAAVFAPMATPFDGAGDVDERGIRSNIERWVRAGLGGIVALGSNGEAPLVDERESDRIIGTARAALPSGRILIAGTGRESTRATIDASRRAAELGADAVLVRTPSFFKPRMTPDVFVRHYTAVADACAVPVLLYNYPALTGVNLAPDTVAALGAHPNIVGIKETGSDTAQVAAYVDRSPAAFSVIAGSAPTFYASLAVGAVGGILAAAGVVPELCVRLFDLAVEGRSAEARVLQRRLTPIAQLVTSVYGVPGLKLAMTLAGYAAGDPRPPLMPAPAEASDRIRTELSRVREES